MKTRTSLKTAASILFLAAFGLTPLAAQQDLAVGQTLITYTPHFFMAVVGGVILAIGFQLLLTSLSVASGISLVGNVEEAFTPSEEEKRERSREGEKEAVTREPTEGGAKTLSREREDEEASEEGTSPIVKISNAIGAWTVVTASISLFFASLLAVRLTLVGTVWMGITLGLIIWAAFFATMAYLEIRSVSTLIGGIFTAAFSGMRASFATARNVFSASPQTKLAEVATQTASALREELSQALDTTQISEKLDEYVDQLRPQHLDYNQIRDDLTDLLRNVRLEEKADLKAGHLDRETFIRFAQDQPKLRQEDVSRLGQTFDEIRTTLGQEGKGSEKVEPIAQTLVGDKADTAKYQAKVEDYLRRTGREELNPEQIKQDIDRIFDDPKSSGEIILKRLNSIDRETLVAVLAQRDGMGEEKARKWMGKIEHAFDFLRHKIMGVEGVAASAVTEKGAQVSGLPKEAEDRIRQYMASLGRPEFDYDRIRLDFERMLHDPKASLKILRARLKLYDRDSLIALLSSREGVSEEDAERMVGKIEEARDNVLHRAETLENEVRRRLSEAKQMALHEAENIRQASATAAWWMVGTAVISGFFSALGAALAITL